MSDRKRKMPWRLQERVNRGEGWSPWRSITHYARESAALSAAKRERDWQARHGYVGREYRVVNVEGGNDDGS